MLAHCEEWRREDCPQRKVGASLHRRQARVPNLPPHGRNIERSVLTSDREFELLENSSCCGCAAMLCYGVCTRMATAVAVGGCWVTIRQSGSLK
jgi:hypothetical protein